MLNNIFSTDSAFGKAIGLPAVSVGRNRYKKIPSSKNTIVPITEKELTCTELSGQTFGLTWKYTLTKEKKARRFHRLLYKVI